MAACLNGTCYGYVVMTRHESGTGWVIKDFWAFPELVEFDRQPREKTGVFPSFSKP